MTRILMLLVALSAAAFGVDLDAIKAEPNLEKRSDRALANANQAIDAARDAYQTGNMQNTQAALDEIVASVNLSWESLKATNKSPRKSPKYFKRAELAIREMLRRLSGMETDFGVEDRPSIQKVAQRLQEIHDELLNGIMSKKK